RISAKKSFPNCALYRSGTAAVLLNLTFFPSMMSVFSIHYAPVFSYTAIYQLSYTAAGVFSVVLVLTAPSVGLGEATNVSSWGCGSTLSVVVELEMVGRLAVQLYRTCRVAFSSPSNSKRSANGFPFAVTFSVKTISV